MTNRISFIVSTVLFSTLVFSSSAKQSMVVFIHGTMHETIRTQPYLYHSDLLLDLGLAPVDLASWKTATESHTLDYYAAFHIIHAFDACKRHIAGHTSNGQHYYTFGWSGALNQQAREKASVELYHALTKEYDRLYAEDPDIEIELYGHSHGNQLILYLANIRNEYPEHTWLVNRAVLSAAPLHYEMAKNAFHDLFRNIINIYSEGDMVQTLDFISVPHGACKRTFRELQQLEPYFVANSKCIVDLRIGAYSHYNFFGHGTFFTLDRYTPHPTLSRCLRHKYRDLITALDPLPLVSLYPLIVPYCYKPYYQSLSANIVYYGNTLQILLFENQAPEHAHIIEIPTDFFVAQDHTKKKYKSVGYTSEIAKLCRACICSLQKMFNRKNHV